MEITKAELCKRDKSCLNLYIDNEFFGKIDVESFLKSGLKNGNEIDAVTLEKLVAESQFRIGFNQSLKLLSSRRKTQKQLEQYLYEKGYKKPIITKIVEKLNNYNYLDDREFAKIFIRQNKDKKGKMAIKKALIEKGVKSVIIDEELGKEETDINTLLKLAEKFLKNKEYTQETKIKLQRHLLSKGFSYEEISKVTEYFKESDL